MAKAKIEKTPLEKAVLDVQKRLLKPSRKPKLVERLAAAAAQPAGFENLRCQRCKLCTGVNEPFQPRRAPEFDIAVRLQRADRVLVVIGQPSPEDDLAGEIGTDAMYLKRELLSAAGLNKGNTTFLSAVACRPVPDGEKHKTGSAPQIELCRPFLLSKIFDLKPTKIIGMGNQAAQALLGRRDVTMKDHTSRIYRLSYGYWTVPYIVTYSPEAAVTGGGYGAGFRQIIAKHIDHFINDRMVLQPFPELEVIERWTL